MRVIHNELWKAPERESYRQLAFGNVIEGMRSLLLAMENEFGISVRDSNLVSRLFYDITFVVSKVHRLLQGAFHTAARLYASEVLWKFVQLNYARD